MPDVPIPTFVPQDAWFRLTEGNLSPNIASTVPLGIDLLPFTDVNAQQQDGIVGSLDGAVIYLAGLAAQLDGGQGWFMWVAASMAVSNATTVFCPFVDTSKPGRWIATGGIAPATQLNQIIRAGGTSNIAPSLAPVVNVFVLGRASAGATTLLLPGSTIEGQTFNIKDSNGDAGTSAIILTAPSIDGETTDTINTDYGARSYVWNTTEWSVR